MSLALIPDDLRRAYTDAGQGHVFEFVDRGLVTAPEAVAGLVRQLRAIDPAYVNACFTETMEAEKSAGRVRALEPVAGVTRLADAAPGEVAAWCAGGLAAIAAGRVGALVLAGGQGTRLGCRRHGGGRGMHNRIRRFDKPKGEYNVGLPSGKSLFTLQAQRILRLRAWAGAVSGRPVAEVSLPWYIMTSPMTDADTRKYFEENDFLGVGRENVFFFEQGCMPCLTFEGKFILESGGVLAQAPDGNGGIYRALHLSGAIADMERRGVESVHAFAVDNAVCRVADPVFMGYCLARGAEVGNKVCPKTGPAEAIGVLCVRDGRNAVVEYSDLPAELKNLRNAAGDLVFSAGNICLHYYSRKFLVEKANPETLPKEYHVARKKILFADPATGRTVDKKSVTANTGVKLESFIFDCFVLSDAMATLEIKREEEFSPVKNAPGDAVDSPDSARRIVSELHRGWLAAAGAAIGGPADALVEASAPLQSRAGCHTRAAAAAQVSPLLSYGGEELHALVRGAVRGAALEAPALLLGAGEPAAGVEWSPDVAGVALRHGMRGALHVYAPRA